MASLRRRIRSDGSVAFNVMYTVGGRQTSATFDDLKSATAFRDMVNTLGASRAMEMWGIALTPKLAAGAWTVSSWVQHHIDHLTGIQPATVARYRNYLRRDIEPTIGHIPLALLSRDDVQDWVKHISRGKPSGKTVKNKAGFLSGCLNAAVNAGHLTRNPFGGVRLPEWHRKEKVFLTHAEFALLLDCVKDYAQPLVRFLVASGCRWGEATALQPADIDVEDGTVRIWKAWKQVPGGWVLGTPKSKKSVRTIDVSTDVLSTLDLTGMFVFENSVGKPFRIHGFHSRVWQPAVELAVERGLKKRPRIHDLRHTCASWMVQGGVDLPVLQAHLGHENITTTIDTYSSIDRSNTRAAAAVIGMGLRNTN